MYNSVKSSDIAERKQHFGDHYISDHQGVLCVCIPRMSHTHIYTGCNRRNGPNFGRVFLMLNYTEKTQNTYIQS